MLRLQDVNSEFKGRIDKQTVHELALNPDNFTGRSDELILSTLVHEMAHVWQETHGEPSRRGYHNRQWAGKMREVGLQPTSTGEPGGMETGQSITHYILPEGRYARAYAQLSDSGYQLHWQSIASVGSAKKTSKNKFTCPECGQNAWAKPGARLICGQCFEELGFAVHRYMNVLLSFISSTYEKPPKDTSRNACIYVDGIKAQK